MIMLKRKSLLSFCAKLKKGGLKSNYFSLSIFLLFFTSLINAQNKQDTNSKSIKDTLDGKIDLSNYIINAHGVIAIPYIITQPALGGIGLAVVPMLITPKKRPDGFQGYIPPDITAGFAMYTANDSWAGGAIRIGSIPKHGIKYRAGLAYADMNLSFYKEYENIGTKELEFNIVAKPIYLELSKKIPKTNLYLGLQYIFSENILKPNFQGEVPEFISEKELNSKIGLFGTFLDFDTRNTIFTPNKGARLNLLYSLNDDLTGSDYKYQDLYGYINYFVPIKENWVSGFRFDFKQTYGNTPFYLDPYVDLKGIPALRYQGKTVLVFDTEQRIDLNFRWSIVACGGIGETIANNETLKTGTFVYNYGTGFRYFLAKSFGLRTGIDIAKGPDSWGYYLVFGHSWNR